MAKKPKTTTQPAPSSSIADILAAINGAGVGSTTQAQVIGGSRFGSLAEPSTFGIWNEATGLDTVHDQRPLYVAGDEWTQLPTDGAQLAALQHQLIAAGYMTDDNIVFGSPDQKTANAMAQLLGTSNAQGTVWQTSLAQRLTQAGQQPATTPHRDPLIVQLTNPDDIRAVIQSGSNSVFGKYLDPVEVEKFVQSYQAQEAAYQTAQYRATGFDPNTGQMVGSGTTPAAQGTTLTAPATGAGEQRQFFEQMAKAHPAETGAAIFQDEFANMVNSLIGRDF